MVPLGPAFFSGPFLWQDFADSELLLSRANVDLRALQAFARAAADFSTDGQLPSLDFAADHRGRPDVAVFDFTSAHASENAAMVRSRRGYQLLVALVGDSLLEVGGGAATAALGAGTADVSVRLSARSPSGQWARAWLAASWPPSTRLG